MFGAILIAASVMPIAARVDLTAEMHKSIKRDLSSTVEFGPDTKLEDIGKLCNARNCYEIGYWIWKTKKHRAQRLLVFDVSQGAPVYLGGYRINGRPANITGAKISFLFPKKWGDEIDFSAGPPQQAWLDGENPTFFK
jgi:hypothetical protein